MESRKKKRVKRKRPMAGWAVWFLKLTQHVILSVAMLCMVALILTGSVYVEGYGYRRWLEPSVDNVDERVGEYLLNDMYGRVHDAIRFAIIRNQMETNGVFDLNKEINVSEYFNRKEGYTLNLSENYFSNAVYRLEDLIRWQQKGGLVYDNTRAVNEFLTVDGKKLEELTTTPGSFQTLCKQMESCMQDLQTNYMEYQNYMDTYKEGKSSFVYYIDMDNGTDDIYTNLGKLKTYNKAELQTYFDGLLCAAVGTNALNYNFEGDFELTVEDIAGQMAYYEYAFGNSAVVYAGFDLSLDADDYYQTVWEAYYNFNPNMTYILLALLGGCGLYYLFVTLYLLYAAGRKVDKDETEYIELRWCDSVYTELFLAWCTALGFGVTFLFILLTEHYMLSNISFISLWMAVIITGVSFAASILVIESLCSLSRRCKTGSLWKNSIIYLVLIKLLIRFFKWIGGELRKLHKKILFYTERSGLWERTWGAMLTEVLIYAVFLFLMSLFINENEPGLALLFGTCIIGMIVIMSYIRMRRKMERAEIVEKINGIVAGESCRVEVDHLSPENASLGRAVNEIGEGIQNAVETSTRDERLKAELLTNVSHDIKTPLTSIINYVDLLKKEQIENPKVQEYIEVLENKSLKLKNLIQDLIEVSKISTGNIEYEMMPINFHELLMQALAEYDEKFTEHCLKLVYNNNVRDAIIQADSRRMWRVMENLLSNVYKYALEGTRIYVEVSGDSEKVSMTMKNISAKELNIQVGELTERFVRGDVSRTTEGSGLGLAIAQNLVIGQGGSFQIMLDGDLFKVKITFELYKSE